MANTAVVSPPAELTDRRSNFVVTNARPADLTTRGTAPASQQPTDEPCGMDNFRRGAESAGVSKEEGKWRSILDPSQLNLFIEKEKFKMIRQKQSGSI
jgi:hypothetical protein